MGHGRGGGEVDSKENRHFRSTRVWLGRSPQKVTVPDKVGGRARVVVSGEVRGRERVVISGVVRGRARSVPGKSSASLGSLGAAAVVTVGTGSVFTETRASGESEPWSEPEDWSDNGSLGRHYLWSIHGGRQGMSVGRGQNCREIGDERTGGGVGGGESRVG